MNPLDNIHFGEFGKAIEPGEPEDIGLDNDEDGDAPDVAAILGFDPAEADEPEKAVA